MTENRINSGKNIVFIGLPGAGKSCFAKQLAAMLGREFVDLDALVEKKAGKAICTIFAEEGEAAFRDMETEAARKAAAEKNIVIAAGGGIVLREENMEVLGQNGLIIFVNRPPAQIVQDIATDGRPLMQADPNRIFQLYEERIALYRKYYDMELNNAGTVQDAEKELQAIARLLTQSEELRFAVIGSPIGHSLSPDIHLPILTHFYEKVSYTRKEVAPTELESWIYEVKHENIRGFNITMPHKKAVMPHLQHIDAEAALLGSVNTVVNDNGSLAGYNTDAEGFHLALRDKGKSFAKSRVVILGSGGVAGTLALKAAKEGVAKISIAAVDAAEAQGIAQKLAAFGQPAQVEITDFEIPTLTALCKQADLLLNCTPLGMTGMQANFTDTSFLQALKSDAMVCDLVYSPARTTLLKEAEKLGLAVMGGLKMLVYQAILADDLFLGFRLNRQKAYARAVKKLSL